MARYRVGVIGCGGIGVQHAAGLVGMDNAELVAGCDLNEDALSAFGERWRDTWGDVALYTDYRQMLDRERLDVVTVATPDNRHVDPVVDAANAGVQAIFCEKPLATSLADADRMRAAVEENGVLFSVDHTRRWIPLWRHLVEEVIGGGQVGEVQYVVGTLSGSRGSLFRNGTHLIDAICWFAGGSPDWVFAHLEDGYEEYDAYAGDGGHVPATEPAVSGYIHFDNAVRGFYTAGSKETASQFSLDIVGESGRLMIDDRAATLVRDGVEENIEAPEWPITGIPAAAQEIVRLIAEGGEESSPGVEAHKAVQITMGFLESQQRGNARVDLH
ncbi:Gfo/Idh/MocA family oxidoreductase [Candidatus Poribacteria bacterium]|nr:Gfo/Idh/MocA family oxidoreductase [Candidatus Poribacteria bacterium]